jgi:hypothetical protein
VPSPRVSSLTNSKELISGDPALCSAFIGSNMDTRTIVGGTSSRSVGSVSNRGIQRWNTGSVWLICS